MYVEFQADQPLNQGDIVKDVTIAYVPDLANPQLVRGEEIIQSDLTQPLADDFEILGRPVKAPVIILSQGCDIDTKNFVSVARIIPFNDPSYPTNNEAKKAKYLREHYQHVGVRPTVYYLQESQRLPRSLVNFLELHTINKTTENMEYLRSNRILRLMPEAVEDLQFRLSFFFGRFAAITDDYMLTEAERAQGRRTAR